MPLSRGNSRTATPSAAKIHSPGGSGRPSRTPPAWATSELQVDPLVGFLFGSHGRDSNLVGKEMRGNSRHAEAICWPVGPDALRAARFPKALPGLGDPGSFGAGGPTTSCAGQIERSGVGDWGLGRQNGWAWPSACIT